LIQAISSIKTATRLNSCTYSTTPAGYPFLNSSADNTDQIFGNQVLSGLFLFLRIKFIQQNFIFWLPAQDLHPPAVVRPSWDPRFPVLCPLFIFQVGFPADYIIERSRYPGRRVFKDSLDRKIFSIFIADGFADGNLGTSKNRLPFSAK
jgi:hypothetical protein